MNANIFEEVFFHIKPAIEREMKNVVNKRIILLSA